MEFIFAGTIGIITKEMLSDAFSVKQSRHINCKLKFQLTNEGGGGGGRGGGGVGGGGIGNAVNF